MTADYRNEGKTLSTFVGGSCTSVFYLLSAEAHRKCTSKISYSLYSHHIFGVGKIIIMGTGCGILMK